MKFPVLALALFSVASSAFAQGTIWFGNRNATPAVNARVFENDGVTPLSTGYVAQLWAGPNAGALAPVGAAVPFRSDVAGAFGYTVTESRTVGTVAPGSNAVLQFRAWRLSDGATYQTASTVIGGRYGLSPSITVATGGVVDPGTGIQGQPNFMVGLQGFNLQVVPVPEPSVIALAGLGLGGLILARRSRKA